MKMKMKANDVINPVPQFICDIEWNYLSSFLEPNNKHLTIIMGFDFDKEFEKEKLYHKLYDLNGTYEFIKQNPIENLSTGVLFSYGEYYDKILENISLDLLKFNKEFYAQYKDLI
jgi:hypothetical protein